MSETYAFDNLIAGNQKKIVQRPGTVLAGEVSARGSVMAKLTATQKWQQVDYTDEASCDEFGIAVEDLDTRTGEVNTTFYVEGEFLESGVTFFYGDTADNWREILAGHGIYLRTSVSTAGV